MPEFAEIARPPCVSQRNPFLFGPTAAACFCEVEVQAHESPILVYPRDQGEFVLDTDASNFGIGAVLSQVQDGEERVIAYASRTLTKPERRYCVTRRELLAVVYFVQHFKNFLLGRPFKIRTDHASLRWLRSFREPEGQWYGGLKS